MERGCWRRRPGLRRLLFSRWRWASAPIPRSSPSFTGCCCALGLIAAFFLTRLLEGMVYAVSMRDPLVLVAVNIVMIAVAVLACCVPARRAMRVDPIQSLRYE